MNRQCDLASRHALIDARRYFASEISQHCLSDLAPVRLHHDRREFVLYRSLNRKRQLDQHVTRRERCCCFRFLEVVQFRHSASRERAKHVLCRDRHDLRVELFAADRCCCNCDCFAHRLALAYREISDLLCCSAACFDEQIAEFVNIACFDLRVLLEPSACHAISSQRLESLQVNLSRDLTLRLCALVRHSRHVFEVHRLRYHVAVDERAESFERRSHLVLAARLMLREHLIIRSRVLGIVRACRRDPHDESLASRCEARRDEQRQHLRHILDQRVHSEVDEVRLVLCEVTLVVLRCDPCRRHWPDVDLSLLFWHPVIRDARELIRADRAVLQVPHRHHRVRLSEAIDQHVSRHDLHVFLKRFARVRQRRFRRAIELSCSATAADESADVDLLRCDLLCDRSDD